MDIHIYYWTGLLAFFIFMLFLDLLVFQKESHTIAFREAIVFSVMWIALAVIFGIIIYYSFGSKLALEYYGAYLVELSLSVDNLFVFILLFSFFNVPQKYRHKVLFWGIIGAFIMRIIFILVGIKLIREFEWVLYIFGLILIYSSIKLITERGKKVSVDKNPVVRIASKFLPVTNNYAEGQFFIRINKKIIFTPLFLTLVVVETTDVMFALDSIPAVFGVTLDPFIAFSSNAFAVLGLRALYFAIANLIELIRFLNYGLSVILFFIGIKMLIGNFVEIPIYITLLVIAFILFVTVLLSLLYPKQEHKIEEN
jgi:tellurite resistance protein TerC